MNTLASITIGLLLIPSLILNAYFLYTKQSNSKGVKVIGVIDGDTIVLEGKSRVRLRHIDAPEKDLCGYEQATKTLTKLALNKYVRVEEEIPDQYGRGMALVYDGNTLINKEMVASGWVRYHSDQSTKTEAIKEESQKAKETAKGIYGLCQSKENTKNPKCTIKGNIDKNKYTDNKKYYYPGCPQYNFTIVEEDIGEHWFCSEKEAQKAGFTKAENCPN